MDTHSKFGVTLLLEVCLKVLTLKHCVVITHLILYSTAQEVIYHLSKGHQVALRTSLSVHSKLATAFLLKGP